MRNSSEDINQEEANGESPLAYASRKRDRNIMSLVERAARTGDAVLAFQPVMQARHPERVAFYEGLIRIFDSTGRIIPAREFIHVVEEKEIGRIIDCLALERGIRALSQNRDLRLSINMSARSIGYKRWMNSLNRGIKRDPTLAERLILEITEASAMLVPELVVHFMNELQQQNVSFALDDFGAGNTALRYLRDFHFDILKIDGQFIRGIHDSADNQVLTQALIQIAAQFDMFTVAEMVETAEDAHWLTVNGIDCLQGYHFGAPSVRAPWMSDDDTASKVS